MIVSATENQFLSVDANLLLPLKDKNRKINNFAGLFYNYVAAN